MVQRLLSYFKLRVDTGHVANQKTGSERYALKITVTYIKLTVIVYEVLPSLKIMFAIGILIYI